MKSQDFPECVFQNLPKLITFISTNYITQLGHHKLSENMETKILIAIRKDSAIKASYVFVPQLLQNETEKKWCPPQELKTL